MKNKKIKLKVKQIAKIFSLFSLTFIFLSLIASYIISNAGSGLAVNSRNSFVTHNNSNINSNTNAVSYSPNSTQTSLNDLKGKTAPELDYPTNNQISSSDIKVGSITTEGSMRGLGAIQSVYFPNMIFSKADISDVSFYDINNQKISWKFDNNWTILNAIYSENGKWNYNTTHYTKSTSDKFTTDVDYRNVSDIAWKAWTDNDSSLTMGVGDQPSPFKSQADAISPIYASGASNFFGQTQYKDQDTGLGIYGQDKSQMKIVFDRPAIVDRMEIASDSNSMDFQDVTVETPSHEVLKMETSQTHSAYNENASAAVKAGNLVSLNSGSASSSPFNQAAADSHSIAGEYWNKREYWGGADKTAYKWTDLRFDGSIDTNLSNSQALSSGTKIISYNAKPGYETLFVKSDKSILVDANANSKVASFGGSKFPSEIPATDQLNHYSMNYNWIVANPGDKIYVYIVKDSFDFAGVLQSTNDKNSSIKNINSDEYASFLAEAKIDSSAFVSKDTHGDYTINVPSGQNVQTIDFQASSLASVKGLFAGYNSWWYWNPGKAQGEVYRFDYEKLKLPKDKNGNYEVSAYVLATKSSTNDIWKNPSYGYAGTTATHDFWSKIDFNKQKDIYFALLGAAKIVFVPNDGYQFGAPTNQQIQTIEYSNDQAPKTQTMNPLISSDSFLGDQNILTTSHSLSTLGKITSAKINFAYGLNLYGIKFYDKNNNVVPYKITDFRIDITNPLCSTVKWTDEELARLTNIESSDLQSSFDIRKQTEDFSYPVWNTVDGKPENGLNQFMPNAITEASAIRFEFSFLYPIAIDHITYSSPSPDPKDLKNISALQYISLTNEDGITYETTPIAWKVDSDSSQWQWNRRTAFDKNGNRFVDTVDTSKKVQIKDWNGNGAGYETSPDTLSIYFGTSTHDWTVKGNPLAEVIKKPQELGEVTGGSFSLFAGSDDRTNYQHSITDVIIYDENGNKLPYTVTMAQGIQSARGGYETDGWYSDLTRIQNSLQDDNSATNAFDQKLPGFNDPVDQQTADSYDEERVLGRYDAYAKVLWNFADGKSHKIGYIKTKTDYPDESWDVPLDKFGNYSAKLGMSLKTTSGETYMMDGEQGTSFDGSALPNGSAQHNAKLPTSSYFGKLSPLHFQKVVFQLGDNIHLNNFAKFYVWEDAFDKYNPANVFGEKFEIFNKELGLWQDYKDFKVTNFDPIKVRISTLLSGLVFRANNFKSVIETSFTPLPSVLRTIALPEDIANLTNVKFSGFDGASSLNIDSLKVSEFMDIYVENQNADGSWSPKMLNYSSGILKNGQKIRITLHARDGASFVLASDGSPLPNDVTSVVTVSGLNGSTSIPKPSAQGMVLNVTGLNSMAIVSNNVKFANEYTFSYSVTRGSDVIDYQEGYVPNNLRNGDEISINLATKAGYLFDDGKGQLFSKIPKFLTLKVTGLQNPMTVTVPNEFNALSQSGFEFLQSSSGNIAINVRPNVLDDAAGLLQKIEQTPNLSISYDVFKGDSIMPSATYSDFNTLKNNLAINDYIRIKLMPGRGYAFGTDTTYLNTQQYQTKEVQVKVTSSIVAKAATYRGASIFPDGINFSGANGSGSIYTSFENSWFSNDLSVLFSNELGTNVTYWAYLFSDPNDAPKDDGTDDNFFDNNSGKWTEKVEITPNTKQIFNNLKNTDVICLVAQKNIDSIWASDVIDTNGKYISTPLGSTYFKKYVVSQLSDYTLQTSSPIKKLNLRMVGPEGHVSFASGNAGYNLSAPIELSDSSNINARGFIISSATKPGSTLANLMPSNVHAFAPWSINGGLDSQTIPKYKTNSDDLLAELKVGQTQWISWFDPLSQSVLPLYAGDEVVILVEGKDDKDLSEGYKYYYKSFTVPNSLNHVIKNFTMPSDSSVVTGLDGAASINDTLFTYDKKSVDVSFTINHGGTSKEFDGIPSSNQYSLIANGDVITVDATPKPGNWWLNTGKNNAFFEDAQPFHYSFTVSGLQKNGKPIPFPSLDISKQDLSITGQNKNAVVNVINNSPLANALLTGYYNLGLKVKSSGLVYWFGDEWYDSNYLKDPNNKVPLTNIAFGDDVYLVYIPKNPYFFNNVPSSLTTEKYFTSTHSIKVNTLALDVFADGGISKNLIQYAGGTFTDTSLNLRVNIQKISPEIGTIKLFGKSSKNPAAAGVPINENTLNKGLSQTIDTVEARLYPNKTNGYWYDYDHNKSSPSDDYYSQTQPITAKRYINPEDVINKLVKVFQDKSILQTIFYGCSTISPYRSTFNVDGAKLAQFVPEINIPALKINFIMNTVNLKNSSLRAISFNQPNYVTWLNTPSGLNDRPTISFSLSLSDNSSDFDIDGQGVKYYATRAYDVPELLNIWSKVLVAPTNDLVANWNESESTGDIEDQNSFNITPTSNLASTYMNLINAGKLTFKLEPTINLGNPEIILNSSDVQISGNSLKFTYRPKLDRTNKKIYLDPAEVYKIKWTSTDPGFKFYDEKKDLSSANFTDTLEATIGGHLNLFKVLGSSVSKSIVLKNNIDGQGEIDASKMNFPATANPDFEVDVYVKRKGVAISVIYNVLNTTKMYDKLQIGDQVTIMQIIRPTASFVKFSGGKTSVVVASETLNAPKMIISITPPTQLTLQQLGLTGIDGLGAIPDIKLLNIRNTDMKITLEKITTHIKSEVTSLNALFNGDKITVNYTAIGGQFNTSPRSNTYEINYVISGLNQAIAVPDLKSDWVKFISITNGVITPEIDWQSIFKNINANDISKMRLTFKLLDKNGNIIQLRDPANPSSNNWLQGMAIDDILDKNSKIKDEQLKLAVDFDQQLIIHLETISGYEFDNFQGTSIEAKTTVTSDKLQKELVNISSFFKFDNPQILPNASGFGTLQDSEFPFDEIAKLQGSQMSIKVFDALHNLVKEYKNGSLPNDLKNGESITVYIDSSNKNRYQLLYGNQIIERFEKSWYVSNMSEVIKLPEWDKAGEGLDFGNINGSGKVLKNNFGVKSGDISPTFKYAIKYSGSTDFTSYLNGVADLSNGDVVKVMSFVPNGYTFVVDENGKKVAVSQIEIPNTYTVSGLLIPKFDITMPDTLKISYDDSTKKYTPQNILYERIQKDQDLTIRYVADGIDYSKWEDIPTTFFENGNSLKIHIGLANKGVIFSDNATQLDGDFTLDNHLISIQDINNLKPFVPNQNGNYDFETNLLPFIPQVTYSYSIGKQILNPPSDIKPGETLVVSLIAAQKNTALIFAKSLATGSIKFTAPKVESGNLIDFTLPNKISWIGDNGFGTINLSDANFANMFKNPDIKFTFNINSSGKLTRTAYSIDDLNVSNQDQVEIVATAINGKFFANGSNIQKKSYRVDGLIDVSAQKTNEALTYSMMGIGAMFALSASSFAVLRTRKSVK